MAQADNLSTTRGDIVAQLLRPIVSNDPEADVLRLFQRFSEIGEEIDLARAEDEDVVANLCDEQEGVALAIARYPTTTKLAAAAKAEVFASFFAPDMASRIDGVLLDQLLGWLRS